MSSCVPLFPFLQQLVTFMCAILSFLFAQTYAYVCKACVYIYSAKHLCIYACTNTHVYMCVYTHTHTHQPFENELETWSFCIERLQCVFPNTRIAQGWSQNVSVSADVTQLDSACLSLLALSHPVSALLILGGSQVFGRSRHSLGQFFCRVSSVLALPAISSILVLASVSLTGMSQT